MVAGPFAKTGVSSILLSAYRFDDDFDLWSGPIFAMLEAGVIAAGAETHIGVVCFHPKYATPDGTSWPGFGHMHSVPRLQTWVTQHVDPSQPQQTFTKEDIAAGGAWQRRTPHATINVLRADQLELAEKQRNSGKLYADNICKLVGVGNVVLGDELRREQEMGA